MSDLLLWLYVGIPALVLLAAIVLAVHLMDRKHPYSGPYVCTCPEPVVDGLGECQNCHRAPRLVLDEHLEAHLQRINRDGL